MRTVNPNPTALQVWNDQKKAWGPAAATAEQESAVRKKQARDAAGDIHLLAFEWPFPPFSHPKCEEVGLFYYVIYYVIHHDTMTMPAGFQSPPPAPGPEGQGTPDALRSTTPDREGEEREGDDWVSEGDRLGESAWSQLAERQAHCTVNHNPNRTVTPPTHLLQASVSSAGKTLSDEVTILP